MHGQYSRKKLRFFPKNGFETKFFTFAAIRFLGEKICSAPANLLFGK